MKIDDIKNERQRLVNQRLIIQEMYPIRSSENKQEFQKKTKNTMNEEFQKLLDQEMDALKQKELDERKKL